MLLSVASRIQNDELIEERTETLHHSSRILSLACSKGGKYLAHGDKAGNVTLRRVAQAFPRFRIGKAGHPVTVVTFHPLQENVIFAASTNGYVNVWRFPTQGTERDVVSAVTVPGYISSMAIDDGGTKLAIAYDVRISVVMIPVQDRDIIAATEISLLPHPDLDLSLNIECSKVPFPIADKIVPRRVFFLNEAKILVTFIGGTRTFVQNEAGWSFSAAMDVGPHHYMGGTAVDPSKSILVSANLYGRLDWYNLRSGKLQMSTEMTRGDSECLHNYAVGVELLDECTALTGHNLGHMLLLSNSSVEPVQRIGEEEPAPCQLVAVAKEQFSGAYTVFGSSWSGSRSTIFGARYNVPSPSPPVTPPSAGEAPINRSDTESSTTDSEEESVDLLSSPSTPKPKRRVPGGWALESPSPIRAPQSPPPSLSYRGGRRHPPTGASASSESSGEDDEVRRDGGGAHSWQTKFIVIAVVLAATASTALITGSLIPGLKRSVTTLFGKGPAPAPMESPTMATKLSTVIASSTSGNITVPSTISAIAATLAGRSEPSDPSTNIVGAAENWGEHLEEVDWEDLDEADRLALMDAPMLDSDLARTEGTLGTGDVNPEASTVTRTVHVTLTETISSTVTKVLRNKCPPESESPL